MNKRQQILQYFKVIFCCGCFQVFMTNIIKSNNIIVGHDHEFSWKTKASLVSYLNTNKT